jgi:hypothetical protein
MWKVFRLLFVIVCLVGVVACSDIPSSLQGDWDSKGYAFQLKGDAFVFNGIHIYKIEDYRCTNKDSNARVKVHEFQVRREKDGSKSKFVIWEKGPGRIEAKLASPYTIEYHRPR